LLGSIHPGENVPAALSPPYRGELLVHGLGFSPDHKTLDVVSIGSNSVTLIDTQANTGKGKIYVGRSPHEAFFRPDGRDLWIAVRGEDYVSVIDPAQQKEVRQIETANVKLRFNLLPQVSMNIWSQMECSGRHFGWRLSRPAGLSQVQMVGASMQGYAERICFGGAQTSLPSVSLAPTIGFLKGEAFALDAQQAMISPALSGYRQGAGVAT
jgi:YVTN family beta-propeller protein